ncbi:MetQ/NlpA family ABC transporter substrate-binding protein [Gordonia soli]|uniref:Putative ABC transporter substrate-binding protein n=1 Tax=Gordonia soli NBRC 108243 TaxID=1223545 RepID=M0QGX0_9ACTN|nr:MetQ/NlpA family ABC transporter substrate-binding protein [Gordonia soli]GAC66672.1 putative ABC transporter substrate-binding protein [Gordonia soli NBRC 108243]
MTTDSEATTQSGGADNTPPSGIEVRTRRKWPFIAGGVVVIVALVVAIVLWRSGGSESNNNVAGATLSVVYLDSNPAEQRLIDYVASDIAPDYDITVDAVGLGDSTTINRAVSTGQYAGTILQHKLWLGQVLQANPDFREEAATGPIFYWNFGVWSDKLTDPKQLPQNATVAIPSDPSNNAQALWVLEQAGLITLKKGADVASLTVADITDNPRNLQFTLLELGAQPRALQDVDALVGYHESLLAAGVPIGKLIYKTQSPETFAGVLTIGSDYKDSENIKNLVKAFNDPRVQKFLASDAEVQKILSPATTPAA